MKAGFKFIAIYSMLSLAILGLSKLIFKELTIETFSYLLYYYIMTLSISVVLYPLLSWALEKYNAPPKVKFISSLFLCLTILNCVPFFYDNGRVLTLDVLTWLFTDYSLLGFHNLGVHVIAFISFTVSYFLFRNDNFWMVNATTLKPSDDL